MTTIYGINNCDTVKKALKWLSKNNVKITFFDFKKQPLTAELLDSFITLNGWQNLINKRSTSYRNLSDDVKKNLTDAIAFDAVLKQPTLLKRPLLIHNHCLYLGFNEQQYQEIFC
jgi:Spx/MgsR family transcriptional regulator